jgi:hypothetical protein
LFLQLLLFTFSEKKDLTFQMFLSCCFLFAFKQTKQIERETEGQIDRKKERKKERALV